MKAHKDKVKDMKNGKVKEEKHSMKADTIKSGKAKKSKKPKM